MTASSQTTHSKTVNAPSTKFHSKLIHSIRMLSWRVLRKSTNHHSNLVALATRPKKSFRSTTWFTKFRSMTSFSKLKMLTVSTWSSSAPNVITPLSGKAPSRPTMNLSVQLLWQSLRRIIYHSNHRRWLASLRTWGKSNCSLYRRCGHQGSKAIWVAAVSLINYRLLHIRIPFASRWCIMLRWWATQTKQIYSLSEA